ncbi:DUF1993 domain-containing protein [Ideonella sp. DXS29W]|uniref:DUF1993 domain-containing protein n=1 Tax=Ideonella lacteola TaxID=2984193 RepID=A0ABU9BIX4_9BURK
MADACLYLASVPVFRRYFGQSAGWFERAQAHGGDALLQARLAPDMLCFSEQMATAAHFSLRASYPLAGLPVPAFDSAPATWTGLYVRWARVAALLDVLDPLAFAGAEARVIHADAGQATLSLDGATFLHQFALPNFHFHLAMAYAILRQQGVPLGKADVDGFHRYPAVAA